MARELPHRRIDDYAAKRLPTDLRYPWHKWLNGSLWFLVEGEDYDPPVIQFQRYLHGYVANHGMKIKTFQNEARTGLFIKAYKNTTADGMRRRAHFRAFERRWSALHFGDDPDEYQVSEHLRDAVYDGSAFDDMGKPLGREVTTGSIPVVDLAMDFISRLADPVDVDDWLDDFASSKAVLDLVRSKVGVRVRWNAGKMMWEQIVEEDDDE